MSILLIPRHGSINTLGPGVNTAGKISEFFKSHLSEQFNGLSAPVPCLTVHNDFFLLIEFTDPVGYFITGDKKTLQMTNRMLLRLTDIKKKNILSSIDA